MSDKHNLEQDHHHNDNLSFAVDGLPQPTTLAGMTGVVDSLPHHQGVSFPDPLDGGAVQTTTGMSAVAAGAPSANNNNTAMTTTMMMLAAPAAATMTQAPGPVPQGLAGLIAAFQQNQPAATVPPGWPWALRGAFGQSP